MKKYLLLAVAVASTSLWAAPPSFENLSKKDIENVSREFAATFSHTGVSAPETDGLWGVEVGVIAGKSNTPELADVVEESDGDGSNFENLYHAGVMARAHVPYDFFAEITLLPEQEISDVEVSNSTFEIGWNAGAFFNLPLDLAVGYNFANSDMSFTQQPVGSIVDEAKIGMKSKTSIIWVGVSKSFIFVTPYLKVGKVNSDTEVTSSADIFGYPGAQRNDEVSLDGGYIALGANFQLTFLKLGAEYSKIMDVTRASAKVSLDF